nr:dilute domain-containing protein c25b8.08 [Quercus suber]
MHSRPCLCAVLQNPKRRHVLRVFTRCDRQADKMLGSLELLCTICAGAIPPRLSTKKRLSSYAQYSLENARMNAEDTPDYGNGHHDIKEEEESAELHNVLPSDLPRSLDDRQNYASYHQETEYYDAWQAPSIAKPLTFNLALHEPDDDVSFRKDFGLDDARMAQMLAAQSPKEDQDTGEVEEEQVLRDHELSQDQKSQNLQGLLFMAASNGDAARVQRLVRGKASELIEIDTVDAEGTPPLVYASCFGHKDVVLALLNAGATVDKQDRNQWTALMWAMTNRHKEIAKILLDRGASTDVKSSSGRTALDFVPPGSEMSDFLQHSGYTIGSVGVTDDFYTAGFSQDRFEEELAESEMRRRMMMESAINLEVDLGNLGLDEQPESPDDMENSQDFVWDRCLHDQMFVFMERDIDRFLDVVITHMTPQRSPSQKPVPANIIFLGARYAHYHASKELLADWLVSAQEKIYAVVDHHQWNMTILAFWISNATLLLYYLKKDVGLAQETVQFQAQMAELIHEIYILIIRDAERRMDKVMDVAMLDHETIPGFEDIHFQNEWKFLRSKTKVKPEPVEKRFRPPSPKRKAQIAPRNITSLISSTLFVLDLYDVHSIVVAQILAQLYYWLGAEIFNRIMSNKRYLARTKAMQIRMNISVLEDWARTNNRQPEHYEGGTVHRSEESTVDAARRHLAPVVQLLQWLQCFSSLGEDTDAMAITIEQLPSLSAKQLLHAVKHYRAEVGEKILSKAAIKYIQEVKSRPKTFGTPLQTASPNSGAPGTPATPITPNGKSMAAVPRTPQADEDDEPESNLLNPALLLPFHLPTSTDMLVTYGAGFGGMNKERERRYIPSVPPEFLESLQPSDRQDISSVYESARFSDGDSST